MSNENFKIQLRKGLLEFCILQVLSIEKLYTSEIIVKLNKSQIIVVEGTVYPLLSRLKNKELFPRASNFYFLDGIRIEYEDGFGLARLSNTTPVIVFRFEGDSKVALESIKEDFRNSLITIMKNIALPF